MSVWLQDLRGFDGENANPAVQALYVEGFSEASGFPLEHDGNGNGRWLWRDFLNTSWLANVNPIYYDYIIKLQDIFCFFWENAHSVSSGGTGLI